METKQANIIIIDDDSAMVTLLTTLLELEKYQVGAVSDVSSEKIMETLANETPDLVIMDVYLKGTNGLDILPKIKSHTATRNVKVIVSSGEDLSEESARAGADYFLLKPYMPSDLLKKISTLIHSNGGGYGEHQSS